MRRRLLAAVLAAGCIVVPAAHADGDPASDYLLSQDTFLPFDANISKEQAEQLNTVVADAKKKGFAVKVAVIAKPFDLGAVPSLYGKPKTYARFLGQELFFLYKGRLLIVMPTGYGASRGGKPLPSAQRVLDTMPARGEGGAALTAAAAQAVQRLAAQNGVRVEIPPVASGNSETSDRIMIAAIAGGLVLLLVCGFAVRRILSRR
ncbi:MAG TPA: hypothetical protein VF232_12220 [Gaiellaceae bacterium]